MRAFAAVCEAVAATRSRLAKRAALATYLAGLDEASLPVACTFLTGRPFPPRDPRTLGVGYAGLRDAIAGAAGVDPAAVDAETLRTGDPGTAAERLLAARAAGSPAEGSEPPAGVSLLEARAAFEAVAALRSPAARSARLGALLYRACPLEAKYLVKIAGGDLRIGLQQRLVEEALAAAFGVPLEAVRHAAMVLGDVGEAARLAKAGRLAAEAPEGEPARAGPPGGLTRRGSPGLAPAAGATAGAGGGPPGDWARPVLFRPTTVMLATPAADAADALRGLAGDALVEDKLDGVRTTAHIGPPAAGGPAEVRLFSRRLEDVTGRFPELVAALAALPGPLILDGEVLAWRDGRALPFGFLQRRLGRKAVTPELVAEVPTVYVAFDCLLAGEGSLLDLPLEARRARLAALPLAPPLFLSPADRVDARAEGAAARLEARFEAARARGNEGLMVKDPASPYRPGTRGRWWLKLKRARATLDVVVVAVEYGHGRRAGVLSDYTFAVRDGDRLVPIGKAYSGLTDAEIAALTRHFLATTVEDRGALRVVEPTVVLEVAFDTIQRSDRHGSGYALRFPRILRIRDDKPVAEISTLEDVAALYRRQSWATPPAAG